MSFQITPIIEAEELLNIFNDPGLIIIDASGNANAKLFYDEKHISGALFIDLNLQLADVKANPADGGRHPLPLVQIFADTIAKSGIQKDSHIVIYDHNNGANAASRFWWMLKAIGHQKVQVLNGGFNNAEKNGIPINNQIVHAKIAEPYFVETWLLPVADINEVERVSQNKNYLIVDVRDAARYKGLTEPIDLIAGHIPGAVNVPYSENLNAEGLFLSPQELRIKYQKIIENKGSENIIVHCGSGVTACHTLLAMTYANFEIPKLYIGSWSEWSRNSKEISKSIASENKQ